jgi:hypothetical protein
MTTLITQQPEAPSQTSDVGRLEAPQITLLGSLDDSQGTVGIGLNTASSKPIFGIIYNGI